MLLYKQGRLKPFYRPRRSSKIVTPTMNLIFYDRTLTKWNNHNNRFLVSFVKCSRQGTLLLL